MQGFCNSLGLFQVNMTNPEGRSGHRRRGWEEEVRSSEMAEVKDEVYHRKKVSCVTYNDKPGNIAWYFYDPFLGVRFVSPSFSVVLLVKSPATWGLKSWRLSLSPWPSWWRKCWVTRYVFLKKNTSGLKVRGRLPIFWRKKNACLGCSHMYVTDRYGST